MSIPAELMTCIATGILMGIMVLAWLDALMIE